jgi:hypothetical protein
MSIQANYSGGLESVAPVTLAGSSKTAVYTPDANNSILAGFKLVNTTGSAIVATCEHYTLADTTDRIIFKRSVPANDTVEVNSVARPMRAGDIFKVTGAANLVVVPIVVLTATNRAT